MFKRYLMRVALWVCASLFLSTPLTTLAMAHSGGTDYQGGHRDHSTGEYHFHHGHGPHQHPDGKCPYGYDYLTGIYSSSSDSGGTGSTGTTYPDYSYSSSQSMQTESPTKKTSRTDGADIFFMIVGAMFGIPYGMAVLYTLLGPIFSSFTKKRRRKESVAWGTHQAKDEATNKTISLPPTSPVPVIKAPAFPPITQQTSQASYYTCPRCNGKMVLRNGRYGRFYGCSNYPRCRYTRNYP